MSSPTAPADLVPNVPTTLIGHKNPALRLTANMLQLGFDELRTLYTTVTRYNQVKGKSEELLKDSDNEVVVRYRQALAEQKTRDDADEAEYQAAIAPLKQARDDKLKDRATKVKDEFYMPAMAALNLDAGIDIDAYTSASTEGKQLAQTLQSTLTTLTKQAETSATSDELAALKALTIPKISGSLSLSDAPNFTPKFAQVFIGEEEVPNTKIKAAEIAKRVGVTRDQFVTALAAPWAGDTSIWSDADPGFTHTFDIYKGDKEDPNTPRYVIKVVKAARTKAATEIEAPTPQVDAAPITGENEAPTSESAPVTF